MKQGKGGLPAGSRPGPIKQPEAAPSMHKTKGASSGKGEQVAPASSKVSGNRSVTIR